MFLTEIILFYILYFISLTLLKIMILKDMNELLNITFTPLPLVIRQAVVYYHK